MSCRELAQQQKKTFSSNSCAAPVNESVSAGAVHEKQNWRKPMPKKRMKRMWTLSTTNIAVSNTSQEMPCLWNSEVKVTLSNSVSQREKKCAFVEETNLSETFFCWWWKHENRTNDNAVQPFSYAKWRSCEHWCCNQWQMDFAIAN